MSNYSTLKDFYNDTIADKQVFAGLLYNKNSEIVGLIFSDTEDENLALISKNKKTFTYEDINKTVSYFDIKEIKYGNSVYNPQNNNLIIDRNRFGYNNVSIRQKLYLFKRTFLIDSLTSLKREKILIPVEFMDNQRLFIKREYVINGKAYNLVPVYTDSYESAQEKNKESLLLLKMSELITAIKNKNCNADGLYINPNAKMIPGINDKSLNLVISKALINAYF